MAGEGNIEKCFQAIQDALETIKTENGYRHDIVKVYRTFNPFLMESLDSLESPALAVGRTPGQDAIATNYDERGYGWRVPVTVLGYIKRGTENAEDDLAVTKGEAFLSDVLARIKLDPAFGTPQTQEGHIENSKILTSNHAAHYDSSGIYIEARFEFYTTTEGKNP